MAFGFYLNFEKLAQKIIQEAIEKLGESNVFDIEGGDNEKGLNSTFVNNLQYGVIAVIFIVNLYESALNTIISKRLNCMDEKTLRLSHYNKLKTICSFYNIDYSKIEGNSQYVVLKEAIDLRNDITHYKTNEIWEGSYVRDMAKIPMGNTKRTLAELFTKSNIQYYYDSVMGFLKVLCDNCKLQINEECNILDCDGRGGGYEFICDTKTSWCNLGGE